MFALNLQLFLEHDKYKFMQSQKKKETSVLSEMLSFHVGSKPSSVSSRSSSVVRNDRTKKKKEEKRQVEVETYVLSADTELMIDQVRRAHQDTFPSLCQLGKYTTVKNTNTTLDDGWMLVVLQPRSNLHLHPDSTEQQLRAPCLPGRQSVGQVQ